MLQRQVGTSARVHTTLVMALAFVLTRISPPYHLLSFAVWCLQSSPRSTSSSRMSLRKDLAAASTASSLRGGAGLKRESVYVRWADWRESGFLPERVDARTLMRHEDCLRIIGPDDCWPQEC